MGDGGRYELKYVVEESRARAIAGFLRGYLRPSRFNRPGPVPGESVVSLYFDSPDLLFYRQASCGVRNRRKLRIRFYDSVWEHPAFLEIKRRVSDVICKDRAMISREDVRRVLRQQWPSFSDGSAGTAPHDGKISAAVWQQFNYWCKSAQARALLYVTYMREAYVGADDGDLRVTFDRQIRATAYANEEQVAVPECGVSPSASFVAPGSVVLELKFNRSCPLWMQQMVRAFNLSRRSVSKYCACVDAIGLPHGRHNLATSQRWTVT